MFIPDTLEGKIFQKYILGFGHAGKIRIQDILGRHFFSRGLMLQSNNGTKFLLDANDWITRIMLKEGNYERGSTLLAMDLMKAGGTFIDIGANFGLFTCQVAVACKDAQVISVEPNYKILSRLLNNIRLNVVEDKVRVFNMAMGDQFEFVSLEQPASNNMGTTQTKVSRDGGLSVLSCPLSFICEKAAINKVRLIKIDIEGNEFGVFEHFPFQIYNVENIILEFNHLSTISLDFLLDFFGSKGFKGMNIYGDLLKRGETIIPENNIWFSSAKL